MMGLGLIWVLLLVGVIAYLMGWRPDFVQGASRYERPGKTPMDVLKERYARGEIDREEYEEKRRDLEG